MPGTKAIDVVVLLAAGVASEGGEKAVSQAVVARILGIGASRVHRSLKSCERAGLYNVQHKQVLRDRLLEFLLHGVQYAYPSKVGSEFVSGDVTRDAPGVLGGPGFVWPVDGGEQKGFAIEPLHKCVVAAARRNKDFGEAIRLVDSLRCGRARERSAASERMREILAV